MSKRVYTYHVDASGNLDAELRARQLLRADGEHTLYFRLQECGPEFQHGGTTRYMVKFARLSQRESGRGISG